MAQIDNIVQVFISRQTTQVSITAFDVPLILVSMANTITAFATERVREYTSLEAVAGDFPTTHPAYIMARQLLSGPNKPSRFKIGKVNSTSSETYAAALQAVMDYDNDWYALLSDTKTDANILALAQVIQATKKFYFTSTAAATATTSGTTTDIGSVLRAANMDRTAILYSPTATTEHPEASWVGTQIIEVPGSNTWEYKRLYNTTVSKLSDAQIATLEAKGYNYYVTIKGVPVTRRGKTEGNSWIDEVILVDWLYARLQEQIFFRFVNTKKIPYTDVGATMIENEIRSVLQQAQANGGIDTFTVRAPRVLSIPEIQRVARTFGDFTFTARLAGAASVVIIRGTVSA